MATPKDRLFFAVRTTDFGEWIDINTWGYLQQTSESKALETDKAIPHWAEDNKVARFAQFKLTEI